MTSQEFSEQNSRHANWNGSPASPQRISPKEPHKVVALHRSGEVVETLHAVLSAHGFTVEGFRRMEDLFQSDPPELMSCLLLEHDPEDGISGFEICRRLRDSGWVLPIVYVANTWDPHTVVTAMRHGAAHFLTTPFEDHVLIQAVHEALWRSRQALCAARINRLFASLTDLERQVVEMAAVGLLNKEIADRLNLAVITIKVYRARAMRKLGADNAAELGHILAFAGIDQMEN